MIEKILAVGNGVRPHLLIRETFVQNLRGQKTVFMGINLPDKSSHSDERDLTPVNLSEVTVAAFRTLVVSNQTEQFIIEALRSSKVLSVSLVAEADGRVVGHIAFAQTAF